MKELHSAKVRALRAKQVAAKLGIGLSSVWRLSKYDPDFPRPFRLAARTTAWDESEIDEFVRTKAAQRGAA